MRGATSGTISVWTINSSLAECFDACGRTKGGFCLEFASETVESMIHARWRILVVYSIND